MWKFFSKKVCLVINLLFFTQTLYKQNLKFFSDYTFRSSAKDLSNKVIKYSKDDVSVTQSARQGHCEIHYVGKETVKNPP